MIKLKINDTSLKKKQLTFETLKKNKKDLIDMFIYINTHN